MFFINQYTKKTDGTLVKAAYDKTDLYAAKAEFFRRQGEAMASSTTAWTLCVLMDEDGAVYMSDKAIKPAEEPEAE